MRSKRFKARSASCDRSSRRPSPGAAQAPRGQPALSLEMAEKLIGVGAKEIPELSGKVPELQPVARGEAALRRLSSLSSSCRYGLSGFRYGLRGASRRISRSSAATPFRFPCSA